MASTPQPVNSGTTPQDTTATGSANSTGSDDPALTAYIQSQIAINQGQINTDLAAGGTQAKNANGTIQLNQLLQNQVNSINVVDSDINSGNYAGAWSTAEAGGLGGSSNSQDAYLLNMMKTSAGLEQLDPSATWNTANDTAFLNAMFASDPTELGQNPSGLWGNPSKAASDAAAWQAAHPGTPIDVNAAAGARPTQNFLEKATPYYQMAGLAAILGPAAGALGSSAYAALPATMSDAGALTAGAAIGGAASGAIGSAAMSAMNGGPITLGSVGKGALLGGAAAGLSTGASVYGANAGVNPAISGAAAKVGTAAAGNIINSIGGGSTPNNSASPVWGTPPPSAQGNNGNMAPGQSTTYNNTYGNVGAGGYNPASSGYGGGGGGGFSTDTTIAGTIPGLISGAAGGVASMAGANAQVNADQNVITTQQNNLGNINNVWATQQGLGQGADTSLGTALGTNGQPADYSGFENMPGYQFAVQQGTQAINRQAAAMGSAYTPNTAQAVGQYVTGTAMSDYNTYIQQLMGAAGLGTTANQGLQTANQSTANNISTAQQNIGQAQAAGYTGVGNAVGGLFSPNGAGTSLIGAAGRYLNGGGGGGNSGGGGGNSGGGGGNSGGGGSGQYGNNPDINPNTGQPYMYNGNPEGGVNDPTIDPSTGMPWSNSNDPTNIVPGFDPNQFTGPSFVDTGGDDNIDNSWDSLFGGGP